MPIYLDRHDTPNEITAEHVAEMHQKDLEVQDEFGCRGFTYWFDDKRKTGFCLIEAPNKKALEKMHHHAHGAVPSQIIEVDEELVNVFLGRLNDPEKNGKDDLIIRETAFRIIMFCQVKTSSLFNNKKSLNDLQGFNKATRHLIKRNGGSMVEKDANGILVSFVSVSKAIQCALELQKEFMQYLGHSVDSGYHLKIGLNGGVPVTSKPQLFEDAIQLAKAFCDVGRGKIVISTEVKILADNEDLKMDTNKDLIHVLSRSEELFLSNLSEFMEKSWQDPNLKIDDFCSHLGCSKSKFYRILTSISGKAPNSFIKDYRLEKALNYLTEQKGNISEIAFDSGFSSPAYFSKCFLERYHILPSAFTKRMADPY